jgi:splicing factor 3A subunit 3
MDSIIEIQRQTHEEIERLERALATVLSRPQSTQQAKLSNEHKASQILDRIHSRVTTLNNHYQDEASRKAETDALSGLGRPDDLGEFYSRLRKIKDYHNKYPDATVGSVELELAAFLSEGNGEGEDGDDEEEDREYTLLSLALLD